jgi:uncharacterized SAM-binding protein YcdF (DUF218 family)
MNSLLTLLGIESWKPILTALVMPPVPFLLLTLLGARLILPRRGLGWFVILLSVTGMWLSACMGTGRLLVQHVLKPPAALTSEAVAELRAAAKAKQPIAIVVLGGGAEQLAPEYGVANLSDASLERLRYGLWLSRETGLPVAFSGGAGWAASPDSLPEATIAARIAQQDFNRPLRWVEDRSRDTRENAQRSIGVLKESGITQIVVVTHHWHMPRAKKLFEAAAAGTVTIKLAPMGAGALATSLRTDWLPTAHGFMTVRRALHEMLGMAVGA